MSEPERITAFNPSDLVQMVEALQQRVADLERQNAELRAEVERLKRRQQRQAAPFSKDAPLATPKKPGRKPGQGRFAHRSAPPPDACGAPPIPVPVTASACPHCGGELVAAESEVASITDLHYAHGVPVRRVPGMLAELTGVRVTQSALTQDALRQAVQAGAAADYPTQGGTPGGTDDRGSAGAGDARPDQSAAAR